MPSIQSNLPGKLIGKVTLTFTDGKYSWQEVYYRAGTAKLSNANLLDPTSLITAVRALAAKRSAMLPQGNDCSTVKTNFQQGGNPKLVKAVIAQVGQPRNSLPLSAAGGRMYLAGGGTQPAGKWDQGDATINGLAADNPYSGIEMLCTLANGLTTKRTLSGVPDKAICDQGWDYASPWETLWSVFAQQLINDKWGVVSNSLTANQIPLAGATAILQISQNDPLGRPTLFFQNPLTFAALTSGCPDYRIQIFCYRSAPGGYPRLGGVYRCSPPVAATFSVGGVSVSGYSVQLKQSFKPLNPFDMGQIMGYPGPTLTSFAAITLGGTVAKKRGGRSDLPRGRSLVVR